MTSSHRSNLENRASAGTMLAFGTGSIAVGVKNTIFGSWLMLYYNQVQGLDPFLAGLALAIALIMDAVTDPMVGVWSIAHELAGADDTPLCMPASSLLPDRSI